MSDFDTFQWEVGEWGERTFPHATPKSVLEHLRREVEELGNCFDDEPESIAEEAADCLLLLLHIAYGFDFSLFDTATAKFELNKFRQWGKPDAQGVVEHVREEDRAPSVPGHRRCL